MALNFTQHGTSLVKWPAGNFLRIYLWCVVAEGSLTAQNLEVCRSLLVVHRNLKPLAVEWSVVWGYLGRRESSHLGTLDLCNIYLSVCVHLMLHYGN
jgi:hypothetical protein